jgi:hypothetical protein
MNLQFLTTEWALDSWRQEDALLYFLSFLSSTILLLKQ